MHSTKAAERINEFFEAGTLRRYRKGEILLQSGDTPKGIYRIEQGFVKVYSIRKSGDLSVHVIYKAGEMFPLTWVYQDKISNVFIEAMDAVVVRYGNKEQFLKLVYGDPDVARLMTEKLSEAHWIYANRVENLGLSRAYSRVVFRLIVLSERLGVPNSNGEVVIEAPITHQDIADSLNMIRETASREIEKLEKRGLVTHRRHRLVVRDLARLRRELSKID